MTTEELKDLIDRAAKVTGKRIQLNRNPEGTWSTWTDRDEDEEDDKWDTTLEACIASLKKWATPKKPETLALTVPYDKVEWYAQHGTNSVFAPLCIAAIKPYQTEGE